MKTFLAVALLCTHALAAGPALTSSPCVPASGVSGGCLTTGAQTIAGAKTFSGAVAAASFAGPLTGNVTGNVSGLAGTCTALATPRTIAGLSFDGTENISPTTSTIADSTDRRYVTDAQSTVLGNTSGTNSGNVTLGAVGSSPNANGASLSSQALTLQPADGTNPGVMTTGPQTIGGAKTFSDGVVAAVTGNASTATALAANPSDCSANQFATTIAASGNLTCAQPSFADLSSAATITQGGTTETASTEDAVLVGASTTDWVPKVLPSCSGGSDALAYNSSTNTFSCNTIAATSGAVTVLYSSATAIGNVGAGEDDLHTYTLPAGKLAANGDSVRMSGLFLQTTNGVTISLKCKFGASSLTFVDTTYFGGSVPIAITMNVMRLTATTQRFWLTATANVCPSIILGNACSSKQTILLTASPAETLSGTVVLKCTGENHGGAAANDEAIQQAMRVEYLPAP